MTGGHYDVDVVLQDPTRKVLYKQIKKQYDSFTWTAEKTGEYVACFSNEFSTFSHKLVYIDFQVLQQSMSLFILFDDINYLGWRRDSFAWFRISDWSINSGTFHLF